MTGRGKSRKLFKEGLTMLLEPVTGVNVRRRSYPPTLPSINSHLVSDAGALYNKARQMVLGEGCSKDFVAAHMLLERVLQLETSASKLRGLAVTLTAMNFIDGRGVRSDSVRALALLLELDQISLGDGSFNLGLFFEGRFGKIDPLTENFDLAAFFYARSSRVGHLAAQTNLALLHIQNRIANGSASLGWSLLYDSAKQGDRVAAEAIEKLSL